VYEAGQSSTAAFKKWRMGGPRLQKASVLGRKRKPVEWVFVLETYDQCEDVFVVSIWLFNEIYISFQLKQIVWYGVQK